MKKTFLLVSAGLLLAASAWAQTKPTANVAIVSTCGRDAFANEIAITEALLSSDPGLHLVERQQIQKIYDEQHVSSCGLIDANQAIKTGLLLGADLFAAVETVGQTNPVPGIVVFDAHTGVTLADVTLAAGNAEANGKALAKVVREAVLKRGGSGSSRRTVSVVSVNSVGFPQEMQQGCEAVGLLLEQRLVNSPNLILLERRRLENVNKEPLQGGAPATNQLASASTLLEITVTRTNATSGLQGAVRLANAEGKEQKLLKAAVPTGSVAELAEALLPKILEALQAVPSDQAPDRAREARRFCNESIFFLANNNPARAMQTAEAAAALAPDDIIIVGNLAGCLGTEAIRIFAYPKDDVKNSVPFALRSAELCLHVRRVVAERGAPMPPLLPAEMPLTIDSDYAFSAPAYWESAAPLYAAADPATQSQLEQLIRLLRECRVVSATEALKRQVARGNISDFAGTANVILYAAAKLAPDSEVWTQDTEKLMELWMDVYRTNSLPPGGTLMVSVRPMARLACFAMGCAEPERRFKGWSLQPADLARLGGIFNKMASHPDAVIQAYGRTCQFALRNRGKKSCEPMDLGFSRALMQTIRGRITMEAPPVSPLYRSLLYAAARDLLDILPDEAFRLKEHQDLLEWMLANKDLSFWTCYAGTYPAGPRFVQYSRFPYPFPTEPVVYTTNTVPPRLVYPTNEFPRLLANEAKIQELIASGKARDLDGDVFTRQFGSLSNEIKEGRKKILELAPGLDLNSNPKVPWVRAEPLQNLTQGQYEDLVAALQGDPEMHSYEARVLTWFSAVQSNRLFGVTRRLEGPATVVNCVEIPLDGSPIRNIMGPLLFPPAALTGACIVHAGKVIIGSRPNGFVVYSEADQKMEYVSDQNGLPASNLGSMAAVNGRLYLAFNQGPIAEYDLTAKQCRILAAQKSAEKLSPLDNTVTGFEVLEMIADPPRQRVLFTTSFNAVRSGEPLIGLWEIDARTGQIRQLFQTYRRIHWVQLNGEDELLIYISRRYAADDSIGIWYGVASIDLRNDTAKVLWQMGGGGTMGPRLVPDEQTSRLNMEVLPPFLHDGDQLWYTGWNRNYPSCLSLKTGETYDFKLLSTGKDKVFRAFGWKLQGRRVVVDAWGEVSVVTLADAGSAAPTNQVASAVAKPQPDRGAGDDYVAMVKHMARKDIANQEIVAGLKRLSDNGDIRAAMWTALGYFRGAFDLPENPEKARQVGAGLVTKLEALAANDDRDAQFLAGSGYYFGIGTGQDLKKAVQWISRAAEGGQPFAMNQLGVFLALGFGVEPDINKARELFARADAQGLKAALRNIVTYGDDWRDDTQRLKQLKTVPLARALGLPKDEALRLLVAKGVLSDAKQFRESTMLENRKAYHYVADGVVLLEDPRSKRIVSVEAHSKDYKREMPLGIKWETNGKGAEAILGSPDDQGWVPGDQGYGTAFRMENIFFALIYENDTKQKLKIWRAHEKWAEKPVAP